jgi:hypothetical protein
MLQIMLVAVLATVVSPIALDWALLCKTLSLYSGQKDPTWR